MWNFWEGGTVVRLILNFVVEIFSSFLRSKHASSFEAVRINPWICFCFTLFNSNWVMEFIGVSNEHTQKKPLDIEHLFGLKTPDGIIGNYRVFMGSERQISDYILVLFNAGILFMWFFMNKNNIFMDDFFDSSVESKMMCGLWICNKDHTSNTLSRYKIDDGKHL